MTEITIAESGMNFGPFPEEDCLWLEKSVLYQRIQQDTPMAEFALVRQGGSGVEEVWIVEAKSSVPHARNSPERFEEYFEEIRQKMVHALHVLFGSWLGRHPVAESGLTTRFMVVQQGAPAIRCVLVINGAPRTALQPIQDKFQQVLRVAVRTLGLPPNAAMVINHEMARDRYRLIA